MRIISIEFVNTAICKVNTSWWKQLMSLFLEAGNPFEIRCWREETDTIKKAQAFGAISQARSTRYEVSVTGILTESIICEILSVPKPEDVERMTAFFTINLDGVLCEHYGKEFYLLNPSDELVQEVFEILEPVKEYFLYGKYNA